MPFTMRTTKPKAGNKYYIRKENGGYSRAILGRPQDPECDVLSNCVGYAYGRFNEIAGLGCCRYLAPVNAENFMQYKGSCETGQVPKPGSCMVWQKGGTLSGSDGAGHVAIVERVVSDTEVICSESGYGCANPFWVQTRKKGADGNWGANASYTFLGFIYNPAVQDDEDLPVSPVKDNDSNNQIEVKTNNLRIRKGAGTSEPILGFAKKGFYEIYESKTGNGYTWYRIGTDQWIAYSAEWACLHMAQNVSAGSVVAGSLVSILPSATYYTGKSIPSWVKANKWIVKSVSGTRAVIDRSEDGRYAICSPIDVKFLIVQ